MEIIFTPQYALSPLTNFLHKGTSFSLPTGSLIRQKVPYENHKALFYHLNWYFGSLPAADQDKIFKLYAQAEELLRRSDDMREVDEDIRDIFADLIDLLDCEKIFNWIRPASMYPWPSASELPRSYQNAVSPKYPEEKTYVLMEYQQLFAFILQMRACLPIWAAYLEKFKNISTDFRDITLVGLLNRSTIDETPAYKRLERYIAACLGSNEDNITSGVIHGISASEYPRWLLCNSMVRKLAVQSLISPQANDASPFVIKHLSNHIMEIMKKTANTFDTPKIKKTPTREEVGDGDRSVYETNHVKESVARGDRWVVQIYLENADRALKALEPDIDKALARQIMQSFDPGSYIPTDEQLLVALWVMSPVVSPRAENDLTRLNSVTICSIAAAVLWHRGHREVATVLASHEGAPINRGGFSTASGTRLSLEMYGKLSKIYPNSERPRSSSANSNSYNAIRETVVDVIRKWQNNLWNTKLPAPLLKQVANLFPEGNTDVLRVAHNMTTALFDVVIDLAQRPLPENAWDKATRLAKEMGLADHPVPWPVCVPEHRPLMAKQ